MSLALSILLCVVLAKFPKEIIKRINKNNDQIATKLGIMPLVVVTSERP